MAEVTSTPPAKAQARASNEALADFHKAYVDALQGEGRFPTLSTIVTSISYADLLHETKGAQRNGISEAASKAEEVAVHNAAILREYMICTKGKYEYYADAVEEALGEHQLYLDRAQYYGN